MTYKAIISRLLYTKKEGDYWDFKVKHHENPAQLVHDIICLANNPNYRGDRYLVFGISDDCELVGTQEDEKRKSQAQIIDTLRKANFASGQFPDVELHLVEFEGFQIDLLIIADRPDKPYFLASDYRHGKKTVRAGAIYSRTQDTNTPMDSTANVADLDKMWRARLGLDETPLSRLAHYLVRYEEWEEVEENNWYYRQFPEFTINLASDLQSLGTGDNSWVRAATNPNAWAGIMVAKYHQTVLAQTECIFFDEMRCKITAPNVQPVGMDGLHYYYFCMDSLEFNFAQFFRKRSAKELVSGGVADGRISARLPLIFFENMQQKTKFMETLRKQPLEIKEPYIRNDGEVIAHCDAQILACCSEAFNRLEEWKKTKPA